MLSRPNKILLLDEGRKALYNHPTMSEAGITPIKRTTRARKTASASVPVSDGQAATSPKTLKAKEDVFLDFLQKVNELKEEFVNLQKEITETKEAWHKEQKDHEVLLKERDQQEEVEIKREKEAYEYEVAKKRRQEEDVFLEKKTKWEKELQERKNEIETDKKELEELRKQVTAFEDQKEKAVKEATALLQKQLQETFANERKLREQEVKSERELLMLRIENLAKENTRQSQEIELLKKSLDTAARELKEVAVKVIESGSQQAKNLTSDS